MTGAVEKLSANVMLASCLSGLCARRHSLLPGALAVANRQKSIQLSAVSHQLKIKKLTADS